MRAALTKQSPAQRGGVGVVIPSPVILFSNRAALTQPCWGATAHSSLAFMGSLPASQKNTNQGAQSLQSRHLDFSFVKTLRLQVAAQRSEFRHGQAALDFPISAPSGMT